MSGAPLSSMTTVDSCVDSRGDDSGAHTGTALASTMTSASSWRGSATVADGDDETTGRQTTRSRTGELRGLLLGSVDEDDEGAGGSAEAEEELAAEIASCRIQER